MLHCPSAKRKRQLILERPQFRLISFCTWDLAEPTRLILTYAGIDYEDINYENYKFYEPDVSPAEFPLLNYNGKILRENDAIARMLAKMYGLAGDGFFEQAQVDSIVAIVKDLNSATLPYFEDVLGFKVTDTEKLFKEIFKPAVSQHCKKLEKYALKLSNSGFLFDSGITYADFSVSYMIQAINSIHPELMSKFPNILLLSQRVFALPQLQFYLSTRPEKQDALFEKIKRELYPSDKKCLTEISDN
uniref:Glutathione S-transferase n=1 Tax=Panagrolaimus sp. PS1159 TaxID=55785 RepID=A0AC35FCL8_9BILA